MFVPEKYLIQPVLVERLDHAAGVTDQMYIHSALEIFFRSFEDRPVEGIRGRLVNKAPISYRLLHQPVELLRGKSLRFVPFHDGCGLPSVAALDLHNRAQSPFEPEAIAASECGLPLPKR